ncbi:MAG: histidine kinase [Marinifilaceae bacterium]|jgi:sensor histidine kinase YesM|nr:histidine kinase [Marinifilaceae bacterium]
MKTNYLNNPFFRIFSAPITAFIVYLFILLISDRLDEISNNFNPTELLVLVIINYSLFETYRFVISVFNKRLRDSRYYYPFLYTLNIILSFVIVWGIFSFYFINIVKISGFTPELISILIVHVLVAIFYHLFHLSISFLDKQQSLLLEKQKLNRKNIEFEMEVFKNKINPNFLFSSLESVIVQIRRKQIQSAESYLENLALFYRKILGNRYSEIINIEDELEKVNQYIYIQNFNYNDKLKLNINFEDLNSEIYVVPNSMLLAFQTIEECQIISSNQSLEIELNKTDNYLEFCFFSNYSLNYEKDKLKTNLQNLNKAIGYYSDKRVHWEEDEEYTKLNIPSIEIE